LLFQDQQNQAARLLLAETLEKNNDLSAAEKEYINLIRQNPENHDLELLLAKFYVRNQKITEAERILKKMVMDYPEHESSRLYLARLYYDNHQYRLMIETLRKTIRDMPKRYKAYEILAGYFADKKDFENAIATMDRFMEKVPAGSNNLKSKLFKAEIFIKENQYDHALKLVEEVIRENPADLQAHRMKGNILLVKQDYMGAIADSEPYSNKNPEI
jgi:predicted Zn-dependent protease